MKELFKRIARALFGPPDDVLTSIQAGPRTEAQTLREKIRKWERQAEEYERMGLTELARRSRQSVRWYRLKLETLEDPIFRRVA